jgi:hypothetical protein
MEQVAPTEKKLIKNKTKKQEGIIKKREKGGLQVGSCNCYNCYSAVL